MSEEVEKPDALSATTFAYLRTLDDHARFMIVKNFLMLLSNWKIREKVDLDEEDLEALWELKEEADSLWSKADSDMPSAFEFEEKAKKLSDNIAREIFSALPPEILERATKKTEDVEPIIPVRRRENGEAQS